MKARITTKDTRLVHQIILKWANSQHMKITVGCNCLVRNGREPMGEIYPRESPWKLYNDPSNHVGTFVPGLSTAQVFDV